MSVIIVGLNHRSVPLRVLEPLTVLPAGLPKALADLTQRDHLDEVVVLSTCMRTEVYAVANRYHGALRDIRDFAATWSGNPPEAFSSHIYDFFDQAAAAHLFKVAAGLDSAMVGEGEILRQVRDAWQIAHEEGACGPVLGLLFRQAVEAGKRVRAETAISRGGTSLSHAALDMASRHLGGLAGRSTLVLGAGEMGQSVAQALSAAPGGARLFVVNRTLGRARELAACTGGEALEWSALPRALREVDLILTCSGSPGQLIEAGEVQRVLEARGGRPLLIVDIAMPRDVDPAAGDLPGVTLLDIEDLKAFTEASIQSRRQEIPHAQAILDEELDRYFAMAAQREMAPLVTALREQAESVRASEMQRLAPRLAGLDARQERAVEALTRGIVAKLLHQPTVTLKAGAGTPRGEQLAQAVRHLFDLE